MQSYLTIFATFVLTFFPNVVNAVKETSQLHVGTTIDDQPIPIENEPLLNQRIKVENQKQVLGAFCGWTFFSLEEITNLIEDVCPRIIEFHDGHSSKLRNKVMSCAPKIPFCSHFLPSYYQGPKEFFEDEGPMYVWPIYSNRMKRFTGMKLFSIFSVVLGDKKTSFN